VAQQPLLSVNAPAVLFSVSSNLSLPVNNSSILAQAALTVLWPDTYPGNGGVMNVDGEYGNHSAAGRVTHPLPGPAHPITGLLA